jgi:hypothetical protein
MNGLGIESFGEMIFLMRPETKSSYYTTGTGSLKKRPVRGVHHSPRLKPRLKKIKLHFYPPLCLHGSLRGEENDMDSAKRPELS